MKFALYDEKDPYMLIKGIKVLSEFLLQTYQDEIICHLVYPNVICINCRNFSNCDDVYSVINWSSNLLRRIDEER